MGDSILLKAILLVTLSTKISGNHSNVLKSNLLQDTTQSVEHRWSNYNHFFHVHFMNVIYVLTRDYWAQMDSMVVAYYQVASI